MLEAICYNCEHFYFENYCSINKGVVAFPDDTCSQFKSVELEEGNYVDELYDSTTE